MRYSSRKLSNEKVITTACNFWRQIACSFQVMSGNILFLGNKIFEIPPFFQTRPGDLGKKVHACSLRFSALKSRAWETESTRKALDNIDLNQMSHRYVSGALQNDWNDPLDFGLLYRSQRGCCIWVSLSYKRSTLSCRHKTGSSGKLLGLYILNMDRMRLKIEIPTVYRLILLPPLSRTEYSQLENFGFGANVGAWLRE